MSQVGTRKHRTPRSWQGALPQYGGRSSDGNLLYYHHTVSEIFFCWSGPAGSWFSGAILARGPNLAKKTGFSDRNFSMVIRRAQNPSSVSLRPMDVLGHYRGRFWDYTVFRRFFWFRKPACWLSQVGTNCWQVGKKIKYTEILQPTTGYKHCHYSCRRQRPLTIRYYVRMNAGTWLSTGKYRFSDFVSQLVSFIANLSVCMPSCQFRFTNLHSETAKYPAGIGNDRTAIRNPFLPTSMLRFTCGTSLPTGKPWFSDLVSQLVSFRVNLSVCMPSCQFRFINSHSEAHKYPAGIGNDRTAARNSSLPTAMLR